MPAVSALHGGAIVESHPDGNVVACHSCGFPHVDPLPSDEVLARFYATEFYGDEKPDYLEKVERELGYWKTVYDDRFDAFERLKHSSGRRILDVGCSGGFFLEHGRSLGWNVLGVEASNQGIAWARRKGLDVIQALVEDVDLPAQGPFDVVHLAFVLEHLKYPAKLIEDAVAALAPGGLLCVEVPNDFSAIQGVVRTQLGKAPYWVVPKHHLNYFDAASLRRLLESRGLEVVEQTSTWPMEWFLLMGDDYVGNEPLGRSCHAKRMQLDIYWSETPEGRESKRAFYRSLSELGIGREVVQIARKAAR